MGGGLPLLFVRLFETGFLCGLGGCPGTLETRLVSNSQRSACLCLSRVLGLKVCDTTARPRVFYYYRVN
ncbi:hypothetical protein I79_008265 [Cricetulus griseus]|uniref:Secreted protein n=1 Tax=Cricetulus griseus TaxID=10029 RepID=G3HCQ1_CRIGR|nr:hypothetical protein I79_008265 [Cricetulus griseus]